MSQEKEIGRMPDRAPDRCAAVKTRWFARIKERMKKSIDLSNANGSEESQEDLDVGEAVKFIQNASERIFYITLHSGGGSMSECAEHEVLFGPYTEEEAHKAVEQLRELTDVRDSDYYSVIVDLSLASTDVEKFVKENKRPEE